jgi:uncharacterized membrane protein YjjP (DUF1212 family)
MDQKKLMEPLKLAGKLIMENGGETYRVEETVCRMGKAFGLREVESFAVPSGVFVSFQCEDGSIQTTVLRVHRGETNLSCVNEVNEVSREVEAGKLDWQGAWDALKAIEQEADPAPQGIRILASGICAAGFAVMFGGGRLDALLAAAAGMLVQAMNALMERQHLHGLSALLFGSFLATLIPHGARSLYAGFLVEAVAAGALMPMLPGLAMTDAVSDTLRGDMVSGMSHFSQAVLTAGLVAGGALAAATVFRMAGGII